MAGFSHAAGPEWAYLAPLTKSHSSPIELESLFVSVTVTRQNAKPYTKVLLLQALGTDKGFFHKPNNTTVFSFARLRELTGSEGLEFFFEAHEDAAPGVAIPDELSFQRLLLAIRHLGLATPESATLRNCPPVLRFFAQPTPEPAIVVIIKFCLFLFFWFTILRASLQKF